MNSDIDEFSESKIECLMNSNYENGSNEVHLQHLQKTIEYLKAKLKEKDLECLLSKQVCL